MAAGCDVLFRHWQIVASKELEGVEESFQLEPREGQVWVIS